MTFRNIGHFLGINSGYISSFFDGTKIPKISKTERRKLKTPAKKPAYYKITSPDCVHHWIISTPKGPASLGVCKYCSSEKEFSNSGHGSSDAPSDPDVRRIEKELGRPAHNVLSDELYY